METGISSLNIKAEKSSSTLCSLCIGCIFDAKRPEGAYGMKTGYTGSFFTWHYRTVAELEKSAEGCYACQWLKKGVERKIARGGNIPQAQLRVKHPPKDWKPTWIRWFQWGMTEGFDFAVWEPDSLLYPPELQDLKTFPIWTAIKPISFEERWPTMQRILDDCLQNHTKCHSPMDDLSLPTRLVDVGTSQDFKPRLVETSHLGPNSTTKYTTLSHRWGTKPTELLQTRQQNLHLHMEGIGIQMIPKTFLDAMKITRQIGLQYIWIDSLCIIQDSIDDWQKEAGLMSNVYQWSYLNIAAIDSLNPTEGCFLDLLNHTVLLQKTGEDSRELHLRFNLPHLSDLLYSPLLTRSWVFQEVILSRRILYCGKDQFIWQCQNHSCSEDGTLMSTVPLSKLEKGDQNVGLNNDSGPVSLPSDIKDWHGWMTRYLLLELTYEKDRVAALAGITQKYQQDHGLTPILGGWKEYLIESLNWYFIEDVNVGNKGDVGSRRSANTEIPSWSFLSQKGGQEVYFANNNNECYKALRILEAGVSWTGVPFTSNISLSTLIVRGILVPFHFKPFTDDNKVLALYNLASLDFTLNPHDAVTFQYFYFDEYLDREMDQNTTVRFCLLLSVNAQTHQLRFLILERISASSSQPEAYRRLGVAMCTFKFEELASHLQGYKELEAPMEILENIFQRPSVDLELV